MSDKSDKLLELARAAFADLSDAEKKVVAAAADGQPAVLSSSDAAENDPEKADAWGNERTVRADVIRWLCTDGLARRRIDPHGVLAKGIKVAGRLDLSFTSVPFPLGLFRSVLPEGINFCSAEIRAVNLNGSSSGPIGADGLTVHGSLFLRDGFHARGEVRLLGAKIGGNLECNGGAFENDGKNALSADGVEVRGGVFLREGFHAKGEVRLLGAKIGGNLDCTGGKFENAGKYALSADGVDVRGEVFLSDGFHAKGEVGLLGAKIGGNLDCHGGTFENAGKDALSADGASVHGTLFLKDGFRAQGVVRLVMARAGVLNDAKASWPAPGCLDLRGFVYDNLGSPDDAKSRLEWIQRQYPKDKKKWKGEFRPQPYEQLAAVLRRMGHESDAKKVIIAKHQASRKYGRLGRTMRLANWLFDWTMGYGYRLRRPLIAAAIFIFAGWFLFWLGWQNDLMVPVKDSAGCPDALCGCFNAFVYSLDAFLPIVNLHQEEYWLPAAEGCLGYFLCGYLWVHIMAGWVITTLLIAGLTGLARRD